MSFDIFDKYNLRFYMVICRELFGRAFTSEMIEKKVKHTEEFYESRHFGGSRVLFTYGSLDTWMPLGHLENSSKVTSLMIDGIFQSIKFV
jgi:hypothetical protein